MEARSNLLIKTGKSWGIGKRRDRPRIGAVRTRLRGSAVGDLRLFQKALNILVFVVGASYVLGFVTVAQIERESSKAGVPSSQRESTPRVGGLSSRRTGALSSRRTGALSPRIPQEFPRIGALSPRRRTGALSPRIPQSRRRTGALSPRIPQEFQRIGVCHKVGDENVLWGPRSAQMCALDSHRALRGNVSGATGPPFE